MFIYKYIFIYNQMSEIICYLPFYFCLVSQHDIFVAKGNFTFSYNCVYILYLLYPLICCWALGLFPGLGYCKLHCRGHRCASIFELPFCVLGKEMELLDHMVVLFVILKRNRHTVSHRRRTTLHQLRENECSFHNPVSMCRLAFSILAVRFGVRRYLIAIRCGVRHYLIAVSI